MSDSSGSPLVPPRDSRLSPEAVAERGFSQAKRGYSESEVRAYLRLVADELAAVARRERDYANRVRSLEERLSAPKTLPSDQDLITALGEETARVLGQARESAVELRAKAEEHARRVVREAQESARELRTNTQQAMEAKSREAEEAARARAKEIVGEARTLRERVLADLNQRRQELERQVADLRAGRGKLVETYQVVERALTHAVHLMADDPSATLPPADVSNREQVADDVPDPAPGGGAAGVDETDAEVKDADAREVDLPDAEASATETPQAETKEAETKDVGALFEKLRSEHPEATELSDSGHEETPTPADDPETEGAAPEAQASDGEKSEADGAASDEPADDEDEAPPEGDAALLATRDRTLAPVADDLSRRAKRALQDEQNDVLDGLRRQRGKIDLAKILPAADEQLARWAHVLQPAADRAYAAGADSIGGTTGENAAGKNAGGKNAAGKNAAGTTSVPGALLTELTDAAVTPLRGRLESSLTSIDARTPADTEIAVAEGLGARYREWRTQDLDVVLGDLLAVAYARGVYDAAPKGARMRWVPAREGKCPDCDDNALEPTVRGAEFPTGQVFPPAHPGCRCLLVVEQDQPT